MLFFRSLLFSIFFFLTSMLVPFLVFLSAPFPLKVRRKVSALWVSTSLFGLKHICKLNYEVTGLDNVPKEPCVIMSKHQSTWETLAFVELFYPYVWVLKRELLYIPIYGWALALIEPIAINRKSGKKAIDQIVKQGSQRLKDGLSVMVFPEGTRVDPRVKRKYGIGGAVLAQKSGAKILPVAHNAGEFWQRRKFLIRPGTVQVSVGKVIESIGQDAASINQAVEAWIESEMKRINARFDQQYPRKYSK